MNLAERHNEHVARVNARLAAKGRCVMHNSEIDRPAAVVIGLPIGNELPLCAECWAWWQGTIADAATADPHNVPEWVRAIDDPCGGNAKGGEGCTCPPPF